ncbi:restriction endonuclease subunit S [Listeria costaricensis]|uniref:restriction endonuclease subunit S n=1 Tax=Listeria costaricensis TaxID=2026604 RepID=UPI000C076CFD|nr:restriction endonuclease subunit S [Listeria costaricensis]
MGNWKTCTIGDLGAVVGGATPSTKKAENYDGGTISWITPKDLAGFSGRFISHGERNITEQGLKSCSTQLMPAHTVLFSSRAPIGYIAIAEQEVCTNQGFKSVVPNEDTDYMFLYYLLKYNKDKIENLGSGTTFKEVSGSTMRGIEVSVPETIEEQRQIASVLSALDDKIEKNTEVNENLLQQASTIFKHWFTDNPSLDTLEQVPLADLCLVVTKGTTPTTLGKPFVSEGINFIKAESILDNHAIDKNKFAFIDSETNDLLRRSIISSGDIVFTIAGTLGRFALIDDSVLPANTNQAVAIIRANKSKVTPEYLYSFFLGNWHNDYYTKRIQQAVQANLSLGTIKSLPIPILSDKAMPEYLGIISPIITMTKANELEITRLRTMRDALLPQLMSGQLDVSDLDL